MHRLLYSPLLLLTLGACTGAKEEASGDSGDNPDITDTDADGDGLTNEEEADLGTDPNSADSDGDGLSDTDEIDAGTDPTAEDSDDDGVADGAELEAGTDPLDSDSDDDGWADGTETATDPLDPEDHPYTGGWDIAACRDDMTGTGNDEGDIARNFDLTDQNGETVDLYSFCDRAVLVVNFAFW